VEVRGKEPQIEDHCLAYGVLSIKFKLVSLCDCNEIQRDLFHNSDMPSVFEFKCPSPTQLSECFLSSPWLGQKSFLTVLIVTCLFWQTGESLKTQSGPFRFLTVWDWSVQFDLKAQAFLNNPLYAEKPKPEKSQRKTARFKVSVFLLDLIFLSFKNKKKKYNLVVLLTYL